MKTYIRDQLAIEEKLDLKDYKDHVVYLDYQEEEVPKDLRVSLVTLVILVAWGPKDQGYTIVLYCVLI